MIEAGLGKEDRLMSGSYIQLREQEALERKQELYDSSQPSEFFVPDVDPDSEESKPTDEDTDDPFGIGGQ